MDFSFIKMEHAVTVTSLYWAHDTGRPMIRAGKKQGFRVKRFLGFGAC